MKKEGVLEKIKETMESVSCEDWWYQWSWMISKVGMSFELPEKVREVYDDSLNLCQEVPPKTLLGQNNEIENQIENHCLKIRSGFMDFLRTLRTTDLKVIYLFTTAKEYPKPEELALVTATSEGYIHPRSKVVLSKVYQALVLLYVIDGFTYVVPPKGTDMKYKWHLVHIGALGLSSRTQALLEEYFVSSSRVFPAHLQWLVF